MCGICGKINFGLKPVDPRLIRRMSRALTHRGPDEEGAYVNGSVGLGHRRLSIIDLSEAARQPMPNEDGTIWIACNGEIYNFQELRKTLESKGHKFGSGSDTEVIIHLYEEAGPECVKQLRGMFAFSLWDEQNKRLVLARDRAGKKPLNYALGSQGLTFASEISSLLEDPDISRQVDIKSLHRYLSYQYVPAPETIFTGVKKLPPAHILIWEKGGVKIERYWSLSYQNKVRLSEEECCQRLLGLLGEAVKIRMVSDVPLGAFLSGGVDSSAVVALMSRFSAQAVKTFSIGFEEESFDELKYARRIAGLFAADHHEYIVKPDALEVLPKLIRHFGEPFADSSAIPTYYLSKMTRQEVTVALSGDGGDESFAGYRRYGAAAIADVYSRFPAPLRKAVFFLARRLPESTRKNDIVRGLKKFIKAADFSKEKRYVYWMSAFDSGAKVGLYSSGLKGRLKDEDPADYLLDFYRQSGAGDFIDATLFVDIMSYLPGDLLAKVDITAMANSLEVRSPFLDHKLMEFAASIPSNLKLKGRVTKYILKKALAGALPKEILRRSKAGFGVPIGAWFRGRLKNYACEVLLDQKSIRRNYFNQEAVESLLKEHFSGRVDHGQRIWALLNLELWHQMFIDGFSNG